ncbi:MAG: CHAD domain-containing protein [Alphaproteobacteria bacterium]
MLNEEVVRRRLDSEAIHQARIGIRRLRSAFSLFGPLVSDSQSKLVVDDLKWISDSFGRVRDLDVFETRMLGARAQKIRRSGLTISPIISPTSSSSVIANWSPTFPPNAGERPVAPAAMDRGRRLGAP